MLETTQLRTGLTVVSEEAPWQHGVSLGLFVRAGVVDEPSGQEGVAHLLEHLVFRGTARFRGDQLSALIEEDGGEVNAYTTKEYTCLWGRTLPQGLRRHLELLSELFLRPRLRVGDMRREVSVIAEERALWLDNPEELACDLLEEEVFEGSPLGRRVLGEPAAIEALTVKDVKAFHARHWLLSRAVLAICGPVPSRELVPLVEEQFGHDEPPTRASAVRTKRIKGVPLEISELAQVHLAVGGPARAFGDPGLGAQELVVQEFGGGPNSRLFVRLREEEALSYGVYAYDTAYGGGGMWGVYTDLPKDGLSAGLRAIAEEAGAMARGRMSEAALRRMQGTAVGARLLGLDGPFSRVEREALQILLGHRESADEEVARIRALDARAVRRAAGELFDLGGWRTVALLPGGRVVRGAYRDVVEGGALRW